jgi:hypothetical protein
MHRRRITAVTVRPDDNLYIVMERYQEAQQPFDRKLPEFPSQHQGYRRALPTIAHGFRARLTVLR